jgi:hypothetical protein
MKRATLAVLLARLVPVRQWLLDLLYGPMQRTAGDAAYHAIDYVRLPFEPPWPVRVAVSVDRIGRPRSKRPPLIVHRVLVVAEKPIPTGLFHNGYPQPLREVQISVVDVDGERVAVQEALDRVASSIIRARLSVGPGLP